MPSQEEQTVQEFGRALFEALLVGDVRTRYETSLDKARQQNKGLRLKLRIQPPELTGLPWEFLYDEGQGEYLCLSSETPLVRYVDLRRAIQQLPVTPPLRILGMVSSPIDLDPLDVEDEKRLVEEAVKDLSADGLVELTWLEGQTWRDLQRAMRRGSWHIFHFIGHGDFDPTSDEGRIAFSDESGRRHLMKATHLARLLDDHHPLRLVFLNSCEGAQGSEGDPFSSTAATLVRRGVPAVVAMQYEISDKAAIEFSRSFYEAVADGLLVDAAVAEARTAVSMGSNLEWGTPVLYMRSPDGRIFDIYTEVRDREEEERQNQLDEFYAQARRSYRDRQWQAVVDIFDQIHALDPDYPDPEGILVSAREELVALEHERTVAALYDQGQRHVEAEDWEQALECFEKVQRLKPGYQETERLLSRVRQEPAKPPTVDVPDLTGQSVSQARSTLENRDLRLGARNEAPSDTISQGEITAQSPEAGTEAEAGSLVSATVSTGPSTVEVPDEIDFQEVDHRYVDLKQQYDSGSLSAEEFDARLQRIMVQDDKGWWWSKHPETGEWHYYDGTTWIQDIPPIDQRTVPEGPYETPSGQPAQQPTTEPRGRDTLWAWLGRACAVIGLMPLLWTSVFAGLAIWLGYRGKRRGRSERIQTHGNTTMVLGGVGLLIQVIVLLIVLVGCATAGC